MIPISFAISGGLIWSKSRQTGGFDLKLHNQVVGWLRKTSFWSSNYRAESNYGTWVFRRCGWFGADMEVIDGISCERIAVFKQRWSGAGTLLFSDGQKFQVSSKGCWRPVWTVTAENQQPVLHVHTRERTVDLPQALTLPESRLALLIMFAWYRVQQAAQDAATVAVMAIATS